jgi:long-chain fatty acid transport protein
MTKLTSILLVAGLGSVAHANAFLLNEFDAKAVGRGNASSATDVDPSSIYYNVGGLAAGPDATSVQIGGSMVTPVASFTDSATKTKVDSSTSTQFVPGIFASGKVTSMVGVGIGLYTPFGLAVKWPTGTPQAQEAQEATLHTFFITPSVGLNLGSFIPGLSVGAGFDLVPATVELIQQVPFGTDPPGSAHLGATATGVGGRIGVMYKPASAPQMSIGVMWRSEVKEDFSGTASFSVDPSTPQFRPLLPPDSDAKTSITLPQQVTAGVAYRAMPSLEFEGNVIWTDWSTFKNLTITLPMSTINSVQGYSDTVSLRLGGEYMIPALGLAARAGFIYDPSPIPAAHLTALLPDIDRYNLTLGGSKSFGDYALHVGLLWVLPGSRPTSSGMTPENKGTFDVSAFVASVTLQGTLGHK